MIVPKTQSDGYRYYGRWAGNPEGHREDSTRCLAEVGNYPSWIRCQCSRKRGYGPNGDYCKQHAKNAAPAERPADGRGG